MTKQMTEVATAPMPVDAENLSEALQRTMTRVVQFKIRRVLSSITPLRNLYYINTPVYQAARGAWLEDFLSICNTLDSSGVSAMVANYATQLQDLSFEEFFSEQNSQLLQEAVEFQTFYRLISEWQVPPDKFASFWPYIDQNVRKLFAFPLPGSQFLIEPAVRRVFSVLDQDDAFEEWQHLKWNWKVFGGTALMGLGGLIGSAGLPVGGILVGGALIVAGAAGLAAQ